MIEQTRIQKEMLAIKGKMEYEENSWNRWRKQKKKLFQELVHIYQSNSLFYGNLTFYSAEKLVISLVIKS